MIVSAADADIKSTLNICPRLVCPVCVSVRERETDRQKEREGPFFPAVVTQLCLVYISSDTSGSKHRSPHVDAPLMASAHVCGWVCLCAHMCEDRLIPLV